METTGTVKRELSFMDKVKRLPPIIWLAAVALVAVVLGLIVIISAASNTYKTPVKMIEKQRNSRDVVTPYESGTEMLNGFCEKESKDIVKIMMKSEYLEDSMEDYEEYYEDMIEGMEDDYGKNFKYRYKIVDKEKIDKDELEEATESLQDMGKEMLEGLEEIEEYDSDDWEDAADSMGLKKSDMKELAKIMEKMGKICKKAKVTAGYELTVEVTLDGSELDEPEEWEETIWVYKINGRWVSEEGLNALWFGFL